MSTPYTDNLDHISSFVYPASTRIYALALYCDDEYSLKKCHQSYKQHGAGDRQPTAVLAADDTELAAGGDNSVLPFALEGRCIGRSRLPKFTLAKQTSPQ